MYLDIRNRLFTLPNRLGEWLLNNQRRRAALRAAIEHLKARRALRPIQELAMELEKVQTHS
jgi:hypothetical protein